MSAASVLGRIYGANKGGDHWYSRVKKTGRRGYGWTADRAGRMKDRASEAYQLFRAGLKQSGTGRPNLNSAWSRAGDAAGRGYKRARHYAGFPGALYHKFGGELDDRITGVVSRYPVATGLGATAAAGLAGGGLVAGLAGGDLDANEQQLLSLYQKYVELGVWNPEEDGGFDVFVEEFEDLS